jgi:hypothetical protein
MALTDGGSATDYIGLTMLAAPSTRLTLSTASSGGSAGNISMDTVMRDGLPHTVRSLWENNNLRAYYDGVLYGPDIDCIMPDDIDQLDVAQSNGNSNQLSGLVWDIRIYPFVTMK